MIEKYSDHAANERTFLAWVRTGIATIAFGFVVEKFNLFVRTLAEASLVNGGRHAALEKLSGSFNRYDGLALLHLLVDELELVVFDVRPGRRCSHAHEQRRGTQGRAQNVRSH